MMHYLLFVCLLSALSGCGGFRAFNVRFIGKSPLPTTSTVLKKDAMMEPKHTINGPFLRKPLRSQIIALMSGFRCYPDAGIPDNVAQFPLILQAIKEFKNRTGNTNIPLKFEVPNTPDWPQELHYFKLGRRLDNLQQNTEFFEDYPHLVAQMAEAGWDPRESRVFDEWRLLLKGLRMYLRIYGNLRVPTNFVVPDEPPWDPLNRNDFLGRKVGAIRAVGRYVKGHPRRKAQLDDMGFEWEVKQLGKKPQPDEEKFANVVKGLTLYKEIVGNLSTMQQAFVVPKEEPWPEELHGFTLGYYAKLIRYTKAMINNRPERVAIMDEIGFDYTGVSHEESNDRQYHIIYAALEVYKQIYGDCLVPHKFVVPSEEPWPEQTWELRLGGRVTAILTHGLYVSNDPEKRQRLTDLGFRWEKRSEMKRQKYLERKMLEEASKPPKRAYKKRKQALHHLALETPLPLAFDEDADPELQAFFASNDKVVQSEAPLAPVEPMQSMQSEQPVQSMQSVQPMQSMQAVQSMQSMQSVQPMQSMQPVQSIQSEQPVQPKPYVWKPRRSFGQALTEKQKMDLAFEQNELAEEKREEIQRRVDQYFQFVFDEDEYRVLKLQTPEEQLAYRLPFNPDATSHAHLDDRADELFNYMHELRTAEDPNLRKYGSYVETDMELLGKTLHHMPSKEAVEYMERVGHRILEFGAHNFEKFVEALTIFKDFYGHVDVPVSYCITQDLVPEMAKLPKLNKAQEAEAVREALGADGKLLDPETRKAFHADLKALSLPSTLIESDVSSVPVFQVLGPKQLDRPQYPKHLYGMQLGEGVLSVRHGDYDGFEDPVRRKILDDLGFDWGNIGVHQRFRFVPLLWGLKIYYRVEEDSVVPSNFVVPRNEGMWPVWMRGMPLGEWVSTARVQQQMLKEYYPERVEILDLLEFAWWIPPSADYPEKYYTPLVQPPKPKRTSRNEQKYL